MQIVTQSGSLVVISAHGTVSAEDYRTLAPRLESIIERQGPVRLLMEMHDFHGWDLLGLWNEILFEVDHACDVERVAVIGDHAWEAFAAKLSGLLTGTSVRYFDRHDADSARGWIQSDDTE